MVLKSEATFLREVFSPPAGKLNDGSTQVQLHLSSAQFQVHWLFEHLFSSNYPKQQGGGFKGPHGTPIKICTENEEIQVGSLKKYWWAHWRNTSMHSEEVQVISNGNSNWLVSCCQKLPKKDFLLLLPSDFFIICDNQSVGQWASDRFWR